MNLTKVEEAVNLDVSAVVAPRHLLYVFALIAVGCGVSPPRPEASAAPPGAQMRRESVSGTVVVLSLDGFRHDYPRRGSGFFARLVARVAHAERLIPPFPSQTFPSHASLATGVSPAHHGILNNRFWDRRRGLYRMDNDVSWYERAPLWIWATRQGIRSYVLHWIGSEGAHGGVSPARSVRFDPATTDDERLERVAGWLRGPAPERPRLIMAYLSGCDRPGHRHGPDSPEVQRCIEASEGRLSRFLPALNPATDTLLLVSDHGMVTTLGRLNVELALRDVPARVVAVGPVAHVYLHRDAADAPRTTPEAVLRLAERRLPHVRGYLRSALPPPMRPAHPHRGGDLVLVTDAGYVFSDAHEAVYTSLPAPGHEHAFGHHGHDPELPAMAGIFMALGRGIRPGRVERASVYDLFPTVCALLGIPAPPDLAGRALRELLRRQAPAQVAFEHPGVAAHAGAHR